MRRVQTLMFSLLSEGSPKKNCIFEDIGLREATKKKTGKKLHNNSCELWGGLQILVCEPQKSVFFRANFPKIMLKLIHNVPFVCLYKIQSLISFISDAGFQLYILPFKIM